MGNTATVLHDFITGSIFNLRIDSHWVLESEIEEPEGNVHDCACIVDLSDSIRDKWLSLDSVPLAIINDSFAYSCAHS